MGVSIQHAFFSPSDSVEASHDSNNEDGNSSDPDIAPPLRRANAFFSPQNSPSESKIEAETRENNNYYSLTLTEKYDDDFEAETQASDYDLEAETQASDYDSETETEAFDYDLETEEDSFEADEKTNPTQFTEQVSITNDDTDHEQQPITRIFRIVGSLAFHAPLRNNSNTGTDITETEEIDDNNDPYGRLFIEAKTF